MFGLMVGDVGATLAASYYEHGGVYVITNGHRYPGAATMFQTFLDTGDDFPFYEFNYATLGRPFPYGLTVDPDGPV